MKDSRVFYSYWSEKSDNSNAEYENADPFSAMTVRLLKAAGLEQRLAETARYDMRIAIKPNLVSPVPAESGATTHPQIVAGIIEYLQALGYHDITIMEGSWVGDSTADSFLYCGYEELAERYGIKLLDTKKDDIVTAEIAETEHGFKLASQIEDNSGAAAGSRRETGISRINICRSALETDFLINVPVLKGHCQTRMSCALKNMKGLIPDSEKRRFHAMGLHRPIAMLNAAIRQDFIVIDHICGDPEFEDGGNPLVRNCIMAACDPIAADVAACQALGIIPESVGYLRLAAESEGGLADIEKIIVEGEPCEAVPDIHRLLDVNYMVDEVESCSACYNVLVRALDRLRTEGRLDRLDERIAIGQGCRGLHGRTGVGSCTGGYDRSVPGCPPAQEDIYAMLRSLTDGDKG